MEPMAPSCHPKKEHHDPFSVPKRSMVLFFDRRHYTNLIGRLVKFNGCWSYDFSCVSYFQIVVVRTVGLSIGWRWFIYRPNGFIFQQVGTNMRVSKTVPRGTVLLTISLFGWLEYCLLCPHSLQNSLSPHGALSSWLLNCNGHWLEPNPSRKSLDDRDRSCHSATRLRGWMSWREQIELLPTCRVD